VPIHGRASTAAALAAPRAALSRHDPAIPLQHLITFFFNDPATPKIYTLSLHDALPISVARLNDLLDVSKRAIVLFEKRECPLERSEEHTSELQSRGHLVCRLLLEKKNSQDDGHFEPSRTFPLHRHRRQAHLHELPRRPH